MSLLWLAFAAFLSHPGAAALHPLQVRRYALDGWTLTVGRDTSSGVRTCRLAGARMRFQDGAVGFDTRMYSGLDDVWYRVDDAQPRPWRDVYPDLVTAGVRLETGGIANPTGGIVWLPTREVSAAATVRIEVPTSRGPRVQRFRLRDFAGMYAAAIRLGCPPSGFTA